MPLAARQEDNLSTHSNPRGQPIIRIPTYWTRLTHPLPLQVVIGSRLTPR